MVINVSMAMGEDKGEGQEDRRYGEVEKMRRWRRKITSRLAFRVMLMRKKTMAKTLKTWVESLSWTQTKALARDYDLY